MDLHKLKKKNKSLITLLLFLTLGLMVCIKEPTYPDIDRHSKLPSDIVKRTPETDQYPPILYSNDYEPPVPLGPGVNTSGAEDSPFILPDGKTLYFVFTPDVRVPVEKQVLDSVTGVWVSYKIDNT